MYADDRSNPIWHRPANTGLAQSAEAPQWLDIRFVRLERGYMSGEMEPFFDTHCNCMVAVRFLGRKDGERIEGGYTVRGLSKPFESTGVWEIARVSIR